MKKWRLSQHCYCRIETHRLVWCCGHIKVSCRSWGMSILVPTKPSSDHGELDPIAKVRGRQPERPKLFPSLGYITPTNMQVKPEVERRHMPLPKELHMSSNSFALFFKEIPGKIVEAAEHVYMVYDTLSAFPQLSYPRGYSALTASRNRPTFFLSVESTSDNCCRSPFL